MLCICCGRHYEGRTDTLPPVCEKCLQQVTIKSIVIKPTKDEKIEMATRMINCFNDEKEKAHRRIAEIEHEIKYWESELEQAEQGAGE